jgi:pimeloyl-ACP methyl ester carboxylesterase
MDTNARRAKPTRTATSTERPVTWDVNDATPTPLTGACVKECEYKDAVEVRRVRRFLHRNMWSRLGPRLFADGELMAANLQAKVRVVLAVLLMLASFQLLAQAQGKERPVEYPTFYRMKQIDGLSIFYREAGPKDAPTLLLLHGFPSSSRMFEPLLARLSDHYHLVAPDYPGFGHSDWPDPKNFAYTFDHCAEIMSHFTEALGLSRYTLYMQDYGGPVGFRLVLAHPERATALIVQNAVAHNEGLGAIWKPRRAFWADRAGNETAFRANFLSLAATRTRHLGSDPDVERYDPDLWTDEFAFLSQPGQADIQTDLFYDYRTNVDAYPKWQAWMRKTQPPLLVIWGKYDPSFDISEPEAYRRDVPNAQVHILDAGHFALDTAADQSAQLIRAFTK